MAVALIIFEGLAIVIVGNVLWIKAVQSIAPGFQEQRGRIWFLGPFLTRQEQFTAEGWRWCRLAMASALGGMVLFVLTSILLFS